MKLVVTIHEPTLESALGAILAIEGEHDAIELRVDPFPAFTNLPDLSPIRAATDRTLIVTDRTGGDRRQRIDFPAAIARGIDFVDVEYRDDLDTDLVARYRDRIVLSHHDFESMPPLGPLAASMSKLGCAHTKIAVTPANFDETRVLLAVSRPGLTLIGMGERGLYARILAPFFGSELAFVSPDDGRAAAPGQLSLDTALAIYGRDAIPESPRLFAVVGDPAGHSLSPAIHNPLFRARGVRAAYAIASVAKLDEVTDAMTRHEAFAPNGISVTAPFKEEAFRFARQRGAEIAKNANDAKAVNTLLRIRDRWIADNTDVDGFAAILGDICGRDRKSVAVIGAGGTARAALVALRRAGMDVTVYNRTLSKAEQLSREFGARAEPLAGVGRFDGEVIIDTSPVEIEVPLRANMTYLRAAYGGGQVSLDRARGAGAQVFDGLDLLRAQAERQNDLFVEACQ